MQQIKQTLNPNSDRHDAGQPDTNFGTQDMGTHEARRDKDVLSAPRTAIPSQQNYETGAGAQGGVGVGHQGNRMVNTQSQNNGGPGYDAADKRGIGAGLGTGRTVGAHNAGGENTNPFLGGEDRDRGGRGRMGWDGSGTGTTGGTAPDNSYQDAHAHDSMGRGTGNNAGNHTGRHVAEAGAATGAVAGLAHHERGEHGDGGLLNNGEQRQHERNSAGNQAGTGTGANTGLSGTYDGHDAVGTGRHSNQNEARGTAGAPQRGVNSLGTADEHALGTHGGGLGTGTGASTGLKGDYGTGPGSAHRTGVDHANGQVPGQGAYGNGSGPNVGGTGRTSQSTSSGTTDVIIGKLEQGAGILLSNDNMRAKGLEKEAKGEALRDVSHAQELVQEATTLRERSAQKKNGVDARTGAGTGSAHDGTSRRV